MKTTVYLAIISLCEGCAKKPNSRSDNTHKANEIGETCRIAEETKSDSPMHNLLVIRGDYDNTAELIDLSEANKTCSRVSDFPLQSWYRTVAAVIDGQIIVACDGGTSRCYVYRPSSEKWIRTHSMLQTRKDAASVMMSPTEWWIIGGFGARRLTTEVFTLSNGFSPYVNVPEYSSFNQILTINSTQFMFLRSQQLIRINSTHFMLLGLTERKVWMFDRPKQQWIRLKDQLETRYHPQYGLVTYPDGRQAVVAAGGFMSKTIEIFDLNSQTWRYGPNMTWSLRGAASVQLGSTFLTIGGEVNFGNGSDVKSSSIYRFDPIRGEFVKLQQKLATARTYFFAAILVPNEVIPCAYVDADRKEH